MKLINLEDVYYEVFSEDGELRNYVSEEALNEMPVIDAEPVKRGEWVTESEIFEHTSSDKLWMYKRCSNCGWKQVIAHFKINEWEQWYKNHWNPDLPTYCRDCGSKNVN